MDVFGEVVSNTSITPEYFWYEMTIEELGVVLESISKKNKEQWELMRLQTFHLIQPSLSKEGVKKLTPYKFMPFPWDIVQEKEVRKVSAEEKTSIINRLKDTKSTGKVAKI